MAVEYAKRYIGKHFGEFKDKHIPLRASSLEEYAALLYKNGATNVRLDSGLEENCEVYFSPMVGLALPPPILEGYKVYTNYEAITTTGKKILYSEIHESNSMGAAGFLYNEDIRSKLLETDRRTKLQRLFTADQRAKFLQESMNISVKITDQGALLDKETLDSIRSEAGKKGIMPYPKKEAKQKQNK